MIRRFSYNTYFHYLISVAFFVSYAASVGTYFANHNVSAAMISTDPFIAGVMVI